MIKYTPSYNPEAVTPPEYENEPIGSCPICGEVLYGGETLYLDKFNEVVGCEFCIRTKSSEDVPEWKLG